jgi:hypothetical protein
MQTAKFVLIIGFIAAFSLACLVSYAEDVPEGIIFVDQSGSVKKHNSRLKSRALLIAFLRTFKKPFRIVLAGFNEEIHQYASVVTETEADIEALAGEIQKIDSLSYCTDLEIPFRYLLERDAKEAIEFALIISDGKPDIWDGKLRHFSEKVKFDPRYEHLNRQYRMLKASGLSADELFDRLRHLYHKRNLELIEEQLSKLRDGIGDRIILWDLSGESGYFKSWAEKSGAQYLPMKTEHNVTPVDLLRYGMLSFLVGSSRIVHEPSPRYRETPSESILPTRVQAKPEIGLEPKPETGLPPSPDLGDESTRPAESTPERISGEGVGGWTISAAVALFVLISWGGMIMVGRFRKKAAERAEHKKELEVEGEIRSIREQRLSELEAELAAERERKKEKLEKELSEYRKTVELKAEAERERRMQELEAGEIEMLSGTQAESAEAGWQDTVEGRLGIEDVQERMGDIVSASINEVSNYISNFIDDEMRRAMGDAEKMWDELIKEETKALESDRQFSIWVPVPPGAMEVHWTNEDGTKMRGKAVNISMDTVLFEAPGFRAESIDRVVCPRLDVVFNLMRSSIHRIERESVVAVLEEFEGNVDDSMRWVEILASIDEREKE